MEGFRDYSLPPGFWRISYDDEAVTAVTHLDSSSPEGVASPLSDKAAEELSLYMEGKLKSFSFPVKASGTPFQERVWKALLSIPYGERVTYREIAVRIGRPRAVRAVGAAIGKNRLGIVVPCHRVVPGKGGDGNYNGGRETKRLLLELEKEYKEK